MMSDSPPDFDVLLSFAGPERAFARAIFDVVEANGVRAFLDEEFQHEIWGKNLVEYLSEMYEKRGRYCVALISEAYCSRAFTRVERLAAFDRALREAAEYLLPVRIDGSWPPGLPKATAYVDIRVAGVLGVCELIARKVRGSRQPLVVPEHVRIPRVPSGSIPAEQLSTYLLEFCRKQSVAVFGALVYDERTAELRKLLRDRDYWEALDTASGPDFEIFAIRDEEEYGSDSSTFVEMMTAASMSRSRDRGYYCSKLLKDYFGEERTRIVYPAFLLFVADADRIRFTRLIPLGRGSIEQTFQRLERLFTAVAETIVKWRDAGQADAAALWSFLKERLLDEDYTLYIQNAPPGVRDAVARLSGFVES